MRIKLSNLTFILVTASVSVSAQNNSLKVYGPGGPAPALIEVAKSFEKEKGIKVDIIFGPQNKWEQEAKNNADLIFSGSEIMQHSQNKVFSLSNKKALYLRPSVIIVRKGNPKSINGIKDIINNNIKTLVVNGAGQAGLWEDIIAKSGNIIDINKFNKNIYSTNNSAQALKEWNTNKDIDAWIIWNHWHNKVKTNSDLVKMEDNYRLYRPISIAYTNKGLEINESKKFVNYLSSLNAQIIFEKHGWKKEW